MINYPLDKTGRQIMPGDTLKVFHFIGARRKRHYMYKFVLSESSGRLSISHLDYNPWAEGYTIPLDGLIRRDVEIVQGYARGGSFYDRPIQPAEAE